MKIGDFVCYAKEAPEKREYCGVWSWDHGLLVGFNPARRTVDIMTNGIIYTVRDELVSKVEADHWHPGMQIHPK